MSRGLIICLWCLLGGVFLPLSAQEPIPLQLDSTLIDDSGVGVHRRANLLPDTVVPKVDTNELLTLDTTRLKAVEFKPNPTKAVIYSAIFPGMGQIYNRKYWKLPIIYGGILGLTYAITWNGRVYNDYNQAFKDLVTNVPNGSYTDYLAIGETADDNRWGGKQPFQDALKRKKDFYRQNRDLAIIVAAGVYVLCMVDAYVDAQLYDFDMSEDLTMRVTPVVWGPSAFSKATVGLQCSITF